METIRLEAHVGEDGLLKLEVPVSARNARMEVVVIAHIVEIEDVDEMGYPLGYFEETFGALADDPLERGDQGEYEAQLSIGSQTA